MKQLSLTIPKPCTENWSNLSPTQLGGFCKSCSKTVTDFTRMSDDEITHFFKNKPGHTCGRFRPDQLKTYTSYGTTNIRPGLQLIYAGFVSLFLTLVNKPSYAQNATPQIITTEAAFDINTQPQNPTTSKPDYTIKGIVKSDYGEPIPGVNIYLKGSTVGMATDADGKFEFPQKLNSGDVLVFCFIGFKTEEYKVPNQPNAVLEIQLEMFGEIMGEVIHDGIYTEREPALHKWWRKVKDLF
jgi:hypothetical protein